MVKVVIPHNPDELGTLGQSIIKKHKADGNSSPLSPLNMQGMEEVLTKAEAESVNVVKMRRDAEKATQNRNLALGIHEGQTVNTPDTILHFATSIRDILLGVYKGNRPLS